MSDDPGEVRVSLVDSKGVEVSCLKITIPPATAPRQFNESSWDKHQTLCKFQEFLKNEDSEGLQVAMRTMDRLECWCEIFKRLSLNPNGVTGKQLLKFWVTYGLYHIPNSLKGDLVYFVDALKMLVPPYSGPSLKLYRGELEARHQNRIYGIAWTSRLEAAVVFARRREPDEGTGVVLEIDATPSMIVVRCEDSHLWNHEQEYIIDPRHIQEVRSLDRSLWQNLDACY